MDLNELILKYNHLRQANYACSMYGQVFDFYLAAKLNIKPRTCEFHKMADDWINYLWQSDKDNILTTLNKFIKSEEKNEKK